MYFITDLIKFYLGYEVLWYYRYDIFISVLILFFFVKMFIDIYIKDGDYWFIV